MAATSTLKGTNAFVFLLILHEKRPEWEMTKLEIAPKATVLRCRQRRALREGGGGWRVSEGGAS